MIRPREQFFFDEGDSLEVLCRKLLEKIREDVWAEVPNKIQVFFKTTAEEKFKNAEIFKDRYEIILPELLIKNMESRVHPVKDGYEFIAKIPFTKTKTPTNSIFLSTGLMSIRKLKGVFFNPEFQNDFAGIEAPKYLQLKFQLSDNNNEEFQELFDVRMREIQRVFIDARETTDLYNSKIEEMFLSEFERRKEKIEKSAEFSRLLKVTKDDDGAVLDFENQKPKKRHRIRERIASIKKVFPNEEVPESLIIFFVIFFFIVVIGALIWLN